MKGLSKRRRKNQTDLTRLRVTFVGGCEPADLGRINQLILFVQVALAAWLYNFVALVDNSTFLTRALLLTKAAESFLKGKDQYS